MVIPPGNYPSGDYYLRSTDNNGRQTLQIPLGAVVQPGQAIALNGHQVLPFDQGGWYYGAYQLVDYKRGGFVAAYGNGYANVKYNGYRNLDARVDDNGNINFDVNTGSLTDQYKAYLVTTDGFAVELPLAPAIPKIGNQGVRLTYYKGSLINAPLFTAGEYTPVVVQFYNGGGGSITHSLPNAIHMDGDDIPFPNVP